MVARRTGVSGRLAQFPIIYCAPWVERRRVLGRLVRPDGHTIRVPVGSFVFPGGLRRSRRRETGDRPSQPRYRWTLWGKCGQARPSGIPQMWEFEGSTLQRTTGAIEQIARHRKQLLISEQALLINRIFLSRKGAVMISEQALMTLRQARERQAHSQLSLGELAHVAEFTIQRIERHLVNPQTGTKTEVHPQGVSSEDDQPPSSSSDSSPGMVVPFRKASSVANDSSTGPPAAVPNQSPCCIASHQLAWRYQAGVWRCTACTSA